MLQSEVAGRAFPKARKKIRAADEAESPGVESAALSSAHSATYQRMAPVKFISALGTTALCGRAGPRIINVCVRGRQKAWGQLAGLLMGICLLPGLGEEGQSDLIKAAG